MFQKILIANRGEIACRVIATAKRLGIATVAVYSEADQNSLHVLQADEAIAIGLAPARDSYLNVEQILAAAKRTDAQAIHPGYGFLSENADFAQACNQAGRIFVGPPSAAIRAMGSKREAKKLMAKADVPLLPGYHDEAQDSSTFQRCAQEIGYPVLVKASAGGGGRGMRVVNSVEELLPALQAAKREALAAFGDDSMLLEKYLTSPRHIEVQVFFDQYGNGVHLFERDCSIQRRYQKVIEEAPAAGLEPEHRQALGRAAIAAAQAVDYVGAGTVEFIVAPNNAFYFMEMNTRLQVEHPVTEMITGVDLVEWQLRVAGGERLPYTQQQLKADGHAIEARVYAEDARRGFLPSVGQITHLKLPTANANIRVDAGVRAFDHVSMHYDALLAKLIVKAADREQAVSALSQALNQIEVAGITTNVSFLAAIAKHRDFKTGNIDTHFIERHEQALQDGSDPLSEMLLALGVLAVLQHRAEQEILQRERSNDPGSPWHNRRCWRLNATGRERITLLTGETEVVAFASYQSNDAVNLEMPSGPVSASITREGELLKAVLDDQVVFFSSLFVDHEVFIFHEGVRGQFQLLDESQVAAVEKTGIEHLTSPMPGTVVAVYVTPGQSVQRGAPLVVLEAMKMEHTITAPYDGVVVAVHFDTGAQVAEEGVELLVLEPTHE